jgi:very-short-patch-repair endonuclease
MNRGYAVISVYKYKLNLEFKPYYNSVSKKGIIFIKKNIGKIPITKIAKQINKSPFFVWKYTQKLNLYSDLKPNLNGENNGMFNRSHTDYSIKNISKTKKTRWKNDKQFREKGLKILDEMHKNQVGKKRSKETCIKIGLIHKNKIVSKSTRKKISIANKGKLKGDKNPMKKEENLRKCIQSNFESPNIPETQIIQLIILNNLPFEFVGDGKLIIKGLCPDFVSKKTKHIIEVYGEYHHNLSSNKKRDKNRKKIYSNFGYKTLIIWSKKIKKNPQKVTEKIIDFYLS